MAEFGIHLKPSAVKDMDGLRRYDAACVADGMDDHLTHNPARESKSRIKRLRGISNPDYSLRVGEYRVFYNVDKMKQRVEVLRVLHKDETRKYYEEMQR